MNGERDIITKLTREARHKSMQIAIKRINKLKKVVDKRLNI